jgi:hypothetical protein
MIRSSTMEPIKTSRFLSTDRLMLLIFITLKLFISLLPFHYGIFRDEFYSLAMSNRLGLGYVDVPPLAPLLLAINRFLFGDSIFALHLIPAISGALFLWLAYRLVKKLGGNNYALFLILAAILLAPLFVANDSIYTYDTFNKLFWLLFSYLMIRLLQTENPKYWIFIGIASGIGLLFKITLLYLALGWVIGLLLTPKRRLLFRREVIGGGLLALLIFSPYLIWEFQHGFISLEYYRNYTGKVSNFSPLGYLAEQIMYLNPATIFIWLGGLYYLLLRREWKVFRSAGIAYLVLLVLSYLLHSKPDLMTPYYVLLLAAGCVWLGSLLEQKNKARLRMVIAGLVILVGLYTLPLARPVLPVNTFIRIYGGAPGGNVERLQVGRLPQFYADRFGWKEMTAKVARVYRSLPEADRAKACIAAWNYGEAGAIEFYGKKYGLPLPPVSGHNQYHVWGPGRFTGEVVISIGIPLEVLMKNYQSVQTAALFTNPYVMPYENNLPIYVCRDPVKQFQEIKPWIKLLI